MRIGVDVGGTKIEAAAMNNAGELIMRRRVATPLDDYDLTIDAIAALIEDIEFETGQRGSLGFGIPGTVSPATGRIKNAPNSPFNGHCLDTDLQARLGRPVRLMNGRVTAPVAPPVLQTRLLHLGEGWERPDP